MVCIERLIFYCEVVDLNIHFALLSDTELQYCQYCVDELQPTDTRYAVSTADKAAVPLAWTLGLSATLSNFRAGALNGPGGRPFSCLAIDLLWQSVIWDEFVWGDAWCNVCFLSLPPMLLCGFESRLGLESSGLSMCYFLKLVARGFLRVLRFPPLLHQLLVQPIK